MKDRIGIWINHTLCLLIFSILLSFGGCQKSGEPNINSKEQLEEKLKEEAERQNLTSIAYCLVKNDKVLHSNAVGFADKTTRIPATDSTRYLVASISKTITAVAVMQLVEKNRISLDDDINAFLPFPVRNPAFPNTKITYRMLLSHTSSLSDNFQENLDLYCYGSDCPLTLAQYLAQVFVKGGTYFSARNFSKKEPGTRSDYSNLGYALLGYLVERITLNPFDVYCKNSIFIPLGMGKTEWRLAPTPVHEIAVPYSSEIENVNNPHYTFPDYPNGGLRTSVLDLSNFLRAFILGGTLNGKKILSSTSVETMKTLQFGSKEQCLSFYYETINRKKYLGHSGGEMGVSTAMFFDVSTGVGVIVFNNDDDAPLENILSLLFRYGEKQ